TLALAVWCRCSCQLSVVLFSGYRRRRSTPFPYTTLFRSPGPVPGLELVLLVVDLLLGTGPGDVLDELVAGVDAPRRRAGRREHRDRKSTRLNSSHVKISYAVFCLKKTTAQTGE